MSRRHAPGWVPNQHGAWAMLATPLLVGLLASHPRWTHLPLTAFWFLGYFAFFAAGLWLKSGRRSRFVPPLRTYAAAATAAGLLTLVLEPRLLRWAPLFLIPFAVGLVAAARRDERSLVSGISTTAGSCLMTMVAFDAGGGTQWTRAWTLTAILAAYFVGTVLYVKTVIRERGDSGFLALSVGFHLAATLAAWFLSPWLALVFALLTARAWLVPPRVRSPKAVGIGEAVATVVVAIVALVVTAPLQ